MFRFEPNYRTKDKVLKIQTHIDLKSLTKEDKEPDIYLRTYNDTTGRYSQIKLFFSRKYKKYYIKYKPKDKKIKKCFIKDLEEIKGGKQTTKKW